MKQVFTVASIILSSFVFSMNANAKSTDHYIYYKSTNPTLEITIENWKSKFVNYAIKNESGKIVEKGKAPVNESYHISIAELPAGVYQLDVAGSQSTFEVK